MATSPWLHRAQRTIPASTVSGIAALLVPLALASGCGSTGDATLPAATGSTTPAQSAPADNHAVVLVSGLATQTPFTTTTEACTTGLSAGDSVSALRDHLVAAGNQVFTAPAQIGPGEISATTGPNASSGCPPALPASLTIDTTAGINAGGAPLVSFVNYLYDQYGITSIDFVGHSMGGLFARSAIGNVDGTAGDVDVTSLITLSTPWTGAYPADYAEGALDLSVCGDEPTCLQVLPDYKSKLSEPEGPDGAANAISTGDLQGPEGWNEAQGADLNGIPVTLIAGDFFTLPDGNAAVWPNDGIVAENSALARGISGDPLRVRSCLVRPDLHTTALAEAQGLPWSSAITWDPVVLVAVSVAVRDVRAGSSTGDTSDC